MPINIANRVYEIGKDDEYAALLEVIRQFEDHNAIDALQDIYAQVGREEASFSYHALTTAAQPQTPEGQGTQSALGLRFNTLKRRLEKKIKDRTHEGRIDVNPKVIRALDFENKVAVAPAFQSLSVNSSNVASACAILNTQNSAVRHLNIATIGTKDVPSVLNLLPKNKQLLELELSSGFLLGAKACNFLTSALPD